jgi:hypothetical protein
MIIDKEVEISIGSTNLRYYKDLGYDCKNRSKLIIKTEHLQRGTGIKINVKCDVCGKENKIYVQKYFMNMDNMNIYTCRVCSDVKRKITNNKKFGVDNASQSDVIKHKKIETTLKNWGVENPSQSNVLKNKKIITHREHFGVDYGVQNREIYIQRMKKQNKIHEYNGTGVLYQGTYEKDFLDKYYNKFKINNFEGKISFIYEDNNKIYIPDFYILDLNLIVEIKSSYWFNKFKQKNIIKEERCIELGYNFIFIINKNYKELDHIVSVLSIQ